MSLIEHPQVIQRCELSDLRGHYPGQLIRLEASVAHSQNQLKLITDDSRVRAMQVGCNVVLLRPQLAGVVILIPTLTVQSVP